MGKPSFLAALSLMVFMMFLTAFTSVEQQPGNAVGRQGDQQAAAGKKEKFLENSQARFQDYNRRFRVIQEKTRQKSEQVYKEQIKVLEVHEAQARKDLKRLKAAGEKSSWRMRRDISQALENFRKSLEKAESELKK